MKVGPSLKIHDLIQALKATVTGQQASTARGGHSSNPTTPSQQLTASSLLKQQGLLHSRPSLTKAQLMPSLVGKAKVNPPTSTVISPSPTVKTATGTSQLSSEVDITEVIKIEPQN